MSNNLETAANEGDEVVIDFKECCIYKVPKILREVNGEAYTPKIVTIGPYHYDENKFADMEKHKKRYKEEFVQRRKITPRKLKELESFVKVHETKIRDQYSEPFDFSSDKFVEMILLDAIFIIECFLRYNRDRSDSLLELVCLETIRRDLQLLEYQLPYFVLEELYKIAFLSITCKSCGASFIQCSSCRTSGKKDGELPTFRILSCVFFSLYNEAPYDQGMKIKHFTDLCRRALVGKSKLELKLGPVNKVKELPNAVKLRKSGVKFGGFGNLDKYLVESKVEKINSGKISLFNEVELKMPPIYVRDGTECSIRNVMALEQCHYPSETYICGYIELMDFLIEDKEDVDYLIKKGVIIMWAAMMQLWTCLISFADKFHQVFPIITPTFVMICETTTTLLGIIPGQT